MRIRPGTQADIEEVSHAYAEAWRTTYQGITPDAFVKGMTAGAAAQIFRDSLQPNEFSYFFYVAQAPGGRLVGFADGGKERSNPQSGLGELYAIYLLKEFQQQGAGRKLFEASVESLLRSGMTFHGRMGPGAQSLPKILRITEWEVGNRAEKFGGCRNPIDFGVLQVGRSQFYLKGKNLVRIFRYPRRNKRVRHPLS